MPPSYYYVNGQRPPGTLLLNMLIKNEEEHLARTLPAWARIIDAWVIGVDDNNTDASRDVISRCLGHLPGAMVTVHFDGMGPTWTRVVEAGWRRFPHITHGILADADFAPMVGTMDKMELDIRVSKALYTIYSPDHQHKRKLDWVYRNMPGAYVQRRTHQALVVPPLPQQEVFITELASLRVDERPGGYQDRAGGPYAKAARYIGFLEADLAEFGPNDTRSLYYLAVGYLDLFTTGMAEHGGQPTAADWDALASSVSYYRRRAAIPGNDTGSREERWFAVLKLGEVHERYYRDWHTAARHYFQALRLDAERADGWYYTGQNLRMRGEPLAAVPLLEVAAHLPMPDRALFHWSTLYTCLAKVEFVRAVVAALGAGPGREPDRLDACAGKRPHHAGAGSDDAMLNFQLRDWGETDAVVLAASALPQALYERYLAVPRRVTVSHLEDAAAAAAAAQAACREGGEPAASFDAQRLGPLVASMLEEARHLQAAAVAAGRCNTAAYAAAHAPPPAATPTRPPREFVVPPRRQPGGGRGGRSDAAAAVPVQPSTPPSAADVLRTALATVRDSVDAAAAAACSVDARAAASECTLQANGGALAHLLAALPASERQTLASAVARLTTDADAALRQRAPLYCRDVRAVVRPWRAALAAVAPPASVAVATGAAVAHAHATLLAATEVAWQRCA